MLLTQEILRIAAARLKDAEVLHSAKRHDGASYLCGYAIELALKTRICKTLKWLGYPETGSEFSGLASFKVHDLELLLKLSGRAALAKLSRIVIVENAASALAAMNAAASVEHGMLEIRDCVSNGLTIKHTYIITSQPEKSLV